MFVCSECGGSSPIAGFCPADGTPFQPIGEDVLLGITIGAYRVARLLGIGGMGRVYKGVHPQIGSRVAIKVLSRECTDRKDLVDRFFSEARAVNLIRHESIVNVLDLAVLPDGRPYIIMEYLDGAPLASVIELSLASRTPVPLGGLARLTAEVLDALGAAHAKGIVHRDLKPDNIFVSPSGRGKVLDFGIAKLTDLGNSATRTGSLLGTPHYMSPEQAAGRVVDLRADLYAMGIILFECTTGAKPFLADSLFELLRMHLEAAPPSPRALRPDLPEPLERVILTALAKTPEQRFPNAEAMSLALQQATAQLAAEQWAPVVAISGRSLPGAWAPTPPQSWQRSGATKSSQPPPSGQHQPSTLSAGQVSPAQPAPPRPSRKGVWIAVAAVVLAAGGITAAIVAGGRKADPDVAVADKPADKPSDPPSRAADPPVAKPASPPPVVVPAEPKPVADPPATPPRPTKTPTPAANDDADLQDMAAELAQRKRLKGGSGAWFDAHALTLAGYDPKHTDVTAFIPWAIAEAKKVVPDATLFRIGIDGLSADGHADFTLPSFAADSGQIELRFVSPSRAHRPADVPLGVPYAFTCELRVEAGPSGVEIRPIESRTICNDAPVPVPHCSAASLWKKAIRAKAGLAGVKAVSELSYYANPVLHQVRWFFDIKDVFSEMFADDC